MYIIIRIIGINIILFSKTIVSNDVFKESIGMPNAR